MRLLASFLLLLILSACAAAPPPPPRAACALELTRLGVDFTPQANFSTPEGCQIEEPVEVRRLIAQLNKPTVMACRLALALRRFDEDTLQPLAQKHFKQPLLRISHAGSYACRSESGRASRLSQHAFGLAIDITGFEFADGGKAVVKSDWRGTGPKTGFLREASHKACVPFSVVLTPNSDTAHQDHFHLDLGKWRKCG